MESVPELLKKFKKLDSGPRASTALPVPVIVRESAPNSLARYSEAEPLLNTEDIIVYTNTERTRHRVASGGVAMSEQGIPAI